MLAWPPDSTHTTTDSLPFQVFVKDGLGLRCTLPRDALVSVSPEVLAALDVSIARRAEAARVSFNAPAPTLPTTLHPVAPALDKSATAPSLPPQPFVVGDVVCQRLSGSTSIDDRGRFAARAGLGLVQGVTAQGIVKVCSLPAGVALKYDSCMLAYGDGSAQGPPPPGTTPPILGSTALGGLLIRPASMTAPILAPLTEADVRVESNASIRGRLLDPDSTRAPYTTNSLAGRPWVEVDVPAGYTFSSFVVGMPVVPIAAYAPYLIEVFAGPHAGGGGMVKIKSVCLPLTKEPTTVLSASEVFGFDPRAVKFRVVR